MEIGKGTRGNRHDAATSQTACNLWGEEATGIPKGSGKIPNSSLENHIFSVPYLKSTVTAHFYTQREPFPYHPVNHHSRIPLKVAELMKLPYQNEIFSSFFIWMGEDLNGKLWTWT